MFRKLRQYHRHARLGRQVCEVTKALQELAVEDSIGYYLRRCYLPSTIEIGSAELRQKLVVSRYLNAQMCKRMPGFIYKMRAIKIVDGPYVVQIGPIKLAYPPAVYDYILHGDPEFARTPVPA